MEIVSAGALELVAHAEEHRERRTDSDRRFALISFDNALECILNTFAHTSDGRTALAKLGEFSAVRKDPRMRARAIEDVGRQRGIAISAMDLTEIHRTRNSLYHDGKGLYPGEQTLILARKLCERVYQVVFGQNVWQDLESWNLDRITQPSDAELDGSPQLLFLNKFYDFLKLFVVLSDDDGAELLRADGLLEERWNLLSSVNDERLASNLSDFMDLLACRRKIVSEGFGSVSNLDVRAHARNLERLQSVLRKLSAAIVTRQVAKAAGEDAWPDDIVQLVLRNGDESVFLEGRLDDGSTRTTLLDWLVDLDFKFESGGIAFDTVPEFSARATIRTNLQKLLAMNPSTLEMILSDLRNNSRPVAQER